MLNTASNGKIGLREFTALYLLTIAAKFSDITPAFLLPKGLTATWMVPLLSALIISVPFLVLLFVLKKTKSTNLVELMEKTLGSYGSFFMLLILFAIILSAAVLNSRSYVETVNTMYMPQTPLPVLYIVFMAICLFIASKGFENIGRTAWIVLPYVKGALFLLLIFVWEDINVLNIFPLAGPGVWEIAKQGVFQTSLYGEIFLFALLAHLGADDYTFKRASFIGLFIAAIELAGMFAIYIFAFDYTSSAHLSFPFHQFTRMANIGRFLTNMEAFFLVFWFVSAIVRISIYLYVTVYVFAKIARLQSFLPLVLPFAALIIWIGMIPDNVIQVELIYRDNYLLHFSWMAIMILPFILWIISRLRGAQNESN